MKVSEVSRIVREKGLFWYRDYMLCGGARSTCERRNWKWKRNTRERERVRPKTIDHCKYLQLTFILRIIH